MVDYFRYPVLHIGPNPLGEQKRRFPFAARKPAAGRGLVAGDYRQIEPDAGSL